MPARVIIDADLCIGSAECNRLVPEAFRLDDDLGISVVLPGAGDIDRERLYTAESACPTSAITVADDEDAR
jgi:ferredoxin